MRNANIGYKPVCKISFAMERCPAGALLANKQAREIISFILASISTDGDIRQLFDTLQQMTLGADKNLPFDKNGTAAIDVLSTWAWHYGTWTPFITVCNALTAMARTAECAKLRADLYLCGKAEQINKDMAELGPGGK